MIILCRFNLFHLTLEIIIKYYTILGFIKIIYLSVIQIHSLQKNKNKKKILDRTHPSNRWIIIIHPLFVET